MSQPSPKALLKKSPLELVRWLTVEQWQAIDDEYMGAPDAGDEPAAKKSKGARKRKGGKASKKSAAAPAPRRYDFQPLFVGVAISVILTLIVYQLGLHKEKLWMPWYFLGYLLPMVAVFFSVRRPPWAKPDDDRRLLRSAMIVLVIVAVSLTVQEYYGERGVFVRAFSERRGDKWFELHSFAWWSGWRVVGYIVFPAIMLLFLRGMRVRDQYVSPRGFRKHLWIYIGLFVLVLPAVLVAAQTSAFKLTYPFYKLSNRSSFDFWSWQMMYWAQFVALEFFFRGFILRTLAPRIGSGAIFVMIVPYCMIHYGKPLPETLGAIIAGLVLGTLAMRTKSIWGGAFIHIAVALTMDSLAVSDCPSAESGQRCPSH